MANTERGPVADMYFTARKLEEDKAILAEALKEFLECGDNAGHNEALKAQAREALAKAGVK